MNNSATVEITEDYIGAQLVSDESFLRRSPLGVVLESRLRMDVTSSRFFHPD